MGVSGTPAKIWSAVAANSLAAISPRIRTMKGKTGGILMSTSAVAHRLLPVPKEGTLASRSIAAPERIMPSPIAKTRKPDAIRSCPAL